MTLSPTSSRGGTAPVTSVFSRTGVVAAADGDYYGVVAAAKTGATAASRYVGATASGAPVAGTFAVGDLVVDQAGGAWTCITAGTPGTWGPAVAAGSVSNTHIAPGAAIAASKIQGGTAATSGGMFLLSTTTLGADGLFDVSGISQAYSDLILVTILRSAAVATSEAAVYLRLNNDSGGNYDIEQINATSTTLASLDDRLDTGFGLANRCPASTAPAGRFGYQEVWLPGYSSTTWQKEMIALAHGSRGTATTDQHIDIFGGVWLNTAAVTRVQLVTASGSNYLAGSQLRIYGRP